jgi:P27 family predicted phage terminase small subunit
MPGIRGQHSGGRNRKSAQAHELAGTYRRDRHGDGESITAPAGVPTPPVELEGEALAEWNRMVGRLQQTRTLSVVDDAALYQYVRLYAEIEALSADQERIAETIAKLEGYIEELPPSERGSSIADLIKLRQIEARYPGQIRQGRMALRQYLVEFGMTPAARGRVKPTKAADDTQAMSPLAQLQLRAKLHQVK